MQNNTENQNALAAIDRGLSKIEPGLWMANRQRCLKGEAHTMRAGINIAKTSSLAGAAVAGGAGLLLGATGVGLIGGGLGLLAYGAVMVADLLDTGRFAPIPFVRTRVSDRLEVLGNAELRDLRSQQVEAQMGAGLARFEADEELYSNLPEELSNEALMLLKHGRLIVSMLGQLPAEHRDLAYLQLCGMYSKFGDALTGLSLQRLKDSVAGHVGGNYSVMRPAEIHQYEPPAYQVGAAAPSFGELPAAMPVGSNTRLNALDVAAVPGDAHQKSAYEMIVASPYRSRLFFGGQRTGKSYLAFNCAIASSAKGANIYYVNMAAWEAEDDGYSSRATMAAVANIQIMDEAQAAREIEGAMRVLEAFAADTKPAVLIFEEWCETSSLNHKHRELLKPFMLLAASAVEQLANTGMKRKKAIYATAPMFVAGSLTQAAKAAKSMELVLVAIAPGRTVCWEGQAITFSSPILAQAAANWHGVIEPVGSHNAVRIALCEGAWVPVGDMPVVVAAEDFKANEVMPAAKTPGTIPGLSKTMPEAADAIARYLQKNEGVEATMGAIAKVFRSDERNAIRPLLQPICLGLVQEDPARYIYKCGADGKAKICFQSHPTVTTWTGDEA